MWITNVYGMFQLLLLFIVILTTDIDPFTADPIKALHFAMLV